MQALQQDTLLKGGAYRIEKILNETDFEITYLSDQFGSDRNVAITEFFMNGICGREGNMVTYDQEDSNDIVRTRDGFRKDAEDQKRNGGVIDVFEENNTVYYVKEYKDDCSIVLKDDSKSDSKNESKKPSLFSRLKWPLILLLALGAGAAYYYNSYVPVPQKDNTAGESKVETNTPVEKTVEKPVEKKEEKKVVVEKTMQESAEFVSLMKKVDKIKKDARSMPGVSQHKVLTELSALKSEYEKTKSKLSAREQERFHKAFNEIIEIVKKNS